MSTPRHLGPHESFAEKYCRHFNVPSENFADDLLRRTLYPHARWLRFLLSDELLAADRAFVSSVGRLSRRRDFAGEAAEFQRDPRNARFARYRARFRISVRRMKNLFESVWVDTQ